MTQTFELLVKDIRKASSLIREFVLIAPDSTNTLPSISPGAHLQVQIPELNDHRCYSLIVTEANFNWQSEPQQYRLAVRLDEEGKGGSKFMHRLQVGDILTVKGPINDFLIEAEQDHNKPVVLIAGGIGITPIASIAHSLCQNSRSCTLHYAARSKDQLAFADELKAFLGDNIHYYTSDANRFDVSKLLETLDTDQHIFVCGPQRMLDTVLEQTKQRGWPSSHVHFEVFNTTAHIEGDTEFTVELKQSGLSFTVPANKTIIQVLEEAGEDPMYDCQRGECGVCTVDVLEGVPDHRDYYLTDKEKASGKLIQICVSRAKSDKLVLDM